MILCVKCDKRYCQKGSICCRCKKMDYSLTLKDTSKVGMRSEAFPLQIAILAVRAENKEPLFP